MSGSNPKKWEVELGCPQCGAPVTLAETDHILSCDYCRVKLFLALKDIPRYFLSPKEGPNKNTIFVPYWRYKGLYFDLTGIKISHRPFDSSQIALNLDFLPRSLGLKTQTMPLKFVTPETEGRFIKPSVPLKDVVIFFANRLKKLDRNAKNTDTTIGEFIGETTSIIYMPYFYKQNTFYDAILGKPVAAISKTDINEKLLLDKDHNWLPRFLPTLCSNCGWDLECDKDSVVIICKNCNQAFQTSSGNLSRVEFEVARSRDKDPKHLPFWRIKLEVDNMDLASYADLARLANLPVMVKKEWEEIDLQFIVPAFKISPQLFLRLSKMMTTILPDDTFSPAKSTDELFPATLPITEAAESLLFILANIVSMKEKLIPLLREAKLTIKKYSLIYLPFTSTEHEIIHTRTQTSFNKNSLKFGRSL